MIDLVRELDELLAAWRTRRTTETATLIDELSSWFALVLPPIAGKTRTERHRSWLALAARQTAVDLPALLATVTDGTTANATEKLEALADWPADPRITWMARRLFQSPPFATSSGDQKVWRRLFLVLENHADPRALAVIDVRSMQKTFAANDRGQAMRARAATVVTHVERIDVTLSPDERAAHEATKARIERELDSGRALRDAVRIEEDDDAQPSKLVYLDWLMERGYKPPHYSPRTIKARRGRGPIPDA